MSIKRSDALDTGSDNNNFTTVQPQRAENLIRKHTQKKTAKFRTYVKTLSPYLPCTLIWTEKSLDIFFILLPTYLLRKFGQIWKKVGTFIRPIDFLKIGGGGSSQM